MKNNLLFIVYFRKKMRTKRNKTKNYYWLIFNYVDSVLSDEIYHWQITI